MFFLSKRLLDPSSATGILNHCKSAVLMSGSMLPMEMHRDVLGLDASRTVMGKYRSPFGTGGTVNIVTEGITTRYSRRDQANYRIMAGKLDAIISRTPGGTAVFFPSYKVMDAALPLMRSRGLLVQKPGMKPQDVRKLIRDFRTGGVLVGVQGGSLSEGVDYCEGEIKTVVIVGVALDEIGLESKALIDHYQAKFGRGWDYGYLYPGTIKALQAAGRARRKESDRVAVVYMDERFQWQRYNWILNKEERIIVTKDPEDEVGDFWDSPAAGASVSGDDG
jgi:DNA excision repair protein ERCC-2